MLRIVVKTGIWSTRSSRNLSALFSTVRNEPVSNRKAFNALELDMGIMNRLDTMNVGFLAKRKMRVAVAKKLDPKSGRNKDLEFDERRKPLPFPFYCVGKVLHTAQDKDTIPLSFPGSPPEIALVGRSNVGKSTLVNALLRFDKSFVQKAIVSEKPGETKYLTFFQLGTSYKPPKHGDPERHDGKLEKTPAMMLVDMPGYGFAFMNEAEKLRCHLLCLDYLVSNPARSKVLKRVVLLLDGRHGLKATDVLFLQDLQRHLLDTVAQGDFGSDSQEAKTILSTIPTTSSRASLSAEYANEEDMPAAARVSLTGKNMKMLSKHLGWKLQIVLTKGDLVERAELCKRITAVSQAIEEKVPSLYHSMLPTLALSAKDLKGVEEMQRDLAAIIPPQWEGAPNFRKREESAGEEEGTARDGKYGDRRGDKRGDKKGAKDERPSFAERRKQRLAELAAEQREGRTEERADKAGKVDKRDKSDKVEKRDKKYRDEERSDASGAAPRKPDKSAAGEQKDAARKDAEDKPTKPSERAGSSREASTKQARESPKARDSAPASEPAQESDKVDLSKLRFSQEWDEILPSAPANAKATPVDTRRTRSEAARAAEMGLSSETDSKPRVRRGISSLLNADSDSDTDNAPETPRRGGRVRRPAPVRRGRKTERDKILEEYGDEIEDYFNKGSLDLDSESDDEGVDWRAAGEASGHWSDEEDERLAQAALMGEIGGYRKNAVGRFKYDTGIIPKAPKKSGRGAQRSQHAQAEESAAESKWGSGPRFSQFKKAAGAEWPRRVPKTKENPKGRHRLHKTEERAQKETSAKGKGVKTGAGGAARGGKGKAGAKPAPGEGKSVRRRYY